MYRLGTRRSGAVLVFMALLASINLIAAPSAFAHHPDVTASSQCDGYGPVIDYVATSWADGAKGSNANIGIYVNDVWVDAGAFSVDNGYTFSGTIEASAWAGQSVTVMARADAAWGNGKASGDARSTTVAVDGDCSGTTTVPETPTTTIPGTYVPGNPKCVDLGYAEGVKSDPPGTDEVIDGVSFDYDGLDSVTVSSAQWDILAVIVKGGNGAQVYTGSFADLVAPVNNGGQQADISHVEACVDPYQATTTTEQETTTTTEQETTTTTEASLEAFVWVNVGRCEDVNGVSSTPVWIRVEPAGSATVTLRGPSGSMVFTENAMVRLEPGRYFWETEAAEGRELTGNPEGSFRTMNCTDTDAMVVVERGTCAYDEVSGVSSEEVEFRIVPRGAALVTVEGPGGPYEITGAGGVLTLQPGVYTWTATAEPGRSLIGQTGGTFTVDSCGPTCSASIGDTVWLDMSEHDGLQQVGESTVAGVVVELLDEEGAVVAVTTTDEEGRYLFDGLCPGFYRVHFELPDIAGLDNERWTFLGGGDAGLDSNADDNGLTELFQLDEGEEDLSWDAGLVAEQVSSTTVSSMPTTTTIPDTSSTTVPATTSTTIDVLPTTTVTVVPTSSTTVPPVTATTLPFTGFELQMTAFIGAIALIGGGALLAATRRRDEDGAAPENIGTW